MAGKLLAFLGTGNYSEVTYHLGGREHTTCYAPAALCRLLEPKPEELIVSATQDAENKHGRGLQDAVGDCVPMRLVRIPAGASEEEMWDIFRIITEQVGEGDTLYFDITHSFRSLPFLSFLVLAYLRTAKDADIAGVYYGAYDARQDSRVPFFDLTPFVKLLDWTTAADRFIRFGDGRDLAELARQEKAEWARAGGIGKGELFPWDRLATTLSDISLALRLIRPHEVMEKAHNLQEHLRTHFTDAASRRAQIFPLTVLLEKVGQAFAPLALDKPRQADRYEDLRRQKALIRWYFDHQQYVQAIALAREWLVSWAVVLTGCPKRVYSKEQREKAENVLNQAGRRLRDKEAGQYPKPEEVPIPEHVAGLWAKITERRNDLLHAGMREQPVSAKNVADDITSFVDEIEILSLSREEGAS
ncbi:MAG: TIGR02221 family CRISPR-associated protein [Anaerolineae bacterium]